MSETLKLVNIWHVCLISDWLMLIDNIWFQVCVALLLLICFCFNIKKLIQSSHHINTNRALMYLWENAVLISNCFQFYDSSFLKSSYPSHRSYDVTMQYLRFNCLFAIHRCANRINICRRTSSCTQPPRLNVRPTQTCGRLRSVSVCLLESTSSSPQFLNPIKKESSSSGSSLRSRAHLSKDHFRLGTNYT